jgi:hypothetical protein
MYADGSRVSIRRYTRIARLQLKAGADPDDTLHLLLFLLFLLLQRTPAVVAGKDAVNA